MKSNEKWQIMPVVLGIAFCGIMAMCGRGIAQDTAATAPPPSERVQQILKPVESLINKNTFALAYIDVKALDVDKSVANWKQLVTDLFTKIKADKRVSGNLARDADINLDAIQAEYFKEIDKDMPDFKAKLDALLKARVKEVYVLNNSRMMTVCRMQVVATFEKNGSPDAVTKAMTQILGSGWDLKFFEMLCHIEKRDDMVIINISSSDKAKLQRMLDAVKPEANPAIIAGLERVKNAPIQVVFAPDPAIRGMMMMGLAAAPEPVNKFGGKTLNDGIQWVSAGLEPMRQIFALTIQSASPEAAQNLYDTILKVFNEAVGKLNDVDSQDRRAYVERIKVFIPQVKGDKLQLVINKQFLEMQSASFTAVGATLLPAIMAANKVAQRNNNATKQALEQALPEQKGQERFYAISDVAKNAYKAGETQKATAYAQELLDSAPKFKGDWNYGNAIYDGNHILGLLALDRGDEKAACDYLIAASLTPGSPQLNSFGPELDLADKLLKRGQKEIVLTFLENISKFWDVKAKLGSHERLLKWEAAIRQGETPKLDRFAY
ncbi:MAG: hypothetical protein FWC50_15525 [Planctomycetaceae bacterium]|nr:hypothetical protein [Planctomycetaceae bacterium]